MLDTPDYYFYDGNMVQPGYGPESPTKGFRDVIQYYTTYSGTSSIITTYHAGQYKTCCLAPDNVLYSTPPSFALIGLEMHDYPTEARETHVRWVRSLAALIFKQGHGDAVYCDRVWHKGIQLYHSIDRGAVTSNTYMFTCCGKELNEWNIFEEGVVTCLECLSV